MKEVKIAELKAHLSAYLSTVRRGEVIVVCDRSTPVARLIPINRDDDELVVEEAVDPPSAARKIKPLKALKQVDVDQVLAEMRADRS